MKKFVILIIGSIIVIAGAFVLVKKPTFVSSNKRSAYSGPIENVRVGNVAVHTIFNRIAEEQGFFKANGLNVEITNFTSGPESLAGLVADKTDIGIAADFVGVRNIFDQPDLRILAQVNQHRIFELAAKKDRIRSPQDLKGKKIGVTKNSAGEYFLGNFLLVNNLKLEDITMVDLTPAEMIAQIEDGTIDAMVVFEPNIYDLKKKLGENFISWDVQGTRNISALVYTKQAFIDKNPDVIKRYIKSLIEAEQYYKTHIEETKQMVATQNKLERDYIDYSWPKIDHHITLDQVLLLGMEDAARWTIKNKLTDKTTVPNYLRYIYFAALQEVKPEAVTIIH